MAIPSFLKILPTRVIGCSLINGKKSLSLSKLQFKWTILRSVQTTTKYRTLSVPSGRSALVRASIKEKQRVCAANQQCSQLKDISCCLEPANKT